jgi:LL-diaminopimelate aminotransferase
MTTINENFLKLPSHYLFPEIDRRVREFKVENPTAEIISLGRGDVSQPLAPAIIEAMKTAVDGMGTREGFHGYGPTHGYDFLADAIIENDFISRGVELTRDEIFISDGTKCDVANIQEIFGPGNLVAVPDPVFPLYVDTNVMAGRSGSVNERGQYEGIIYLPCTAENDFIPEPPDVSVDLVYLCSPNNPTGAVTTKSSLERWITYAHEHDAVILFDAVYAAYIRESDIPRSIYEIDGAREVAIEFRSFSKTAGFTGLRCALTVVPNALKVLRENGEAVQVNPVWRRRHMTKFNGASYITQVGAAAVYSETGRKQTRATVDFYLNNAAAMRNGLERLDYTVYGGIDAPFLWMCTPQGYSSWEFFERLLKDAYLVGTPGAGFGASGEGYIRFSAFASQEDIHEALSRLSKMSL